jgi:endonuclease/exonuclease/phosphatase family metal-dependent hydrolase
MQAPSPEPTPNPIPETTPTPDPVPTPEPMPDPEPEPVKTENITIASWNLVSFNQTKSSNSSIFNVIEEIVKQFDITFLQEISEDDSFSLLCDELSQYKCESSSFSGKNSSKGKYGLIYNEDFKLDDFNDRNVNSNSNWERPPIKAEFEFGEENIYLYNFRSRPEEAQEELEFLETLIEDVEDVEEDIIIVLGDLAADCDYYDYDSESEFKADWTWIIKNDEDTTSTSEDCAYDRIIMSDEAEKEYINSGIYKTNITENVSDHYLIWVEIEVESD